MKHPFILALSLAWLTSLGVSGQPRPQSIEGVWQAVEVTHEGPTARTIRPQPNLTIITATHYSRNEIPSERPRPVLADITKATADELRAVWGPFTGEAGTYELTSGNLITMRPIVAKNPAVMVPGTFSTFSYKLDGDMLWVTAERNQYGPISNPETVKLIRVE